MFSSRPVHRMPLYRELMKERPSWPASSANIGSASIRDSVAWSGSFLAASTPAIQPRTNFWIASGLFWMTRSWQTITS